MMFLFIKTSMDQCIQFLKIDQIKIPQYINNLLQINVWKKNIKVPARRSS